MSIARTNMTFFDKVWATVAPAKALLRMQAKRALEMQFGYNDKPEQRGWSGGMTRNAAAESWAKHRDRYKMMWDAREQVEHDWIGGALGRVVLYTLGKLSNKSATGDPQYDAIYNKYVADWSGGERDDDGHYLCDRSGRFPLRKQAQFGLFGMFTDGDHGYEWIPGGEGMLPTLMNVEADCIGSPLDASQSESYVGGFNIDTESGRIESARIFQRTRMSMYVQPRDVPVSNFFHLRDPDRVAYYRGRSHLLRLLNINRDLRETMDGESIAIKTQAQYAAFTQSRNPYDERNGAGYGAKNGEPTANGTRSTVAEWGKIIHGTEGESISFLSPSARPSGAFLNFVQVRIKQMAISLGISYGLLWDLLTLGGATARIEVKSDERRIHYWQQLVVDYVLSRARRLLLAHGVAFDGLPAHPRMNDSVWHFGQGIVVDAGYETSNDLQLLNAGIVRAESLASKYNDGDTLRDIMESNAGAVNTAQEIAVEKNVPIEMFARGMWPDATAQIAAMNTPPEDLQPPPPGTLPALGDKAVKQIVEILESAADGSLPREEAVNTLVTVYGLPPEQAEAITPQKQKERTAGVEDAEAKPSKK